MKVDTLKAAALQKHPIDDMDEPETATPTSSQTDSFSRRFSSSSSSLSSHSTLKSQRHISSRTEEMLEKRIHYLENQIRHHVERETELKTYILQLEQRNEHQEGLKPMERVVHLINALQTSHRTQDMRQVFESQIKTLEATLSTCQEERDEFEMTLEMVRREMETMLEELEDTRQQRVRYKTQANRLRAGIEAIQKRSDDNEEDEQKEALRVLYHEAERQAVDLERECKRQTLTLSSLRQEAKVMEGRYHAVKVERAKEVNALTLENERIKRQVEALVYQREQRQECVLTKKLDESLQELRNLYERDLKRKEEEEDGQQRQMKTEQSLCMEEQSREYQRKLDMTTVQVTREIRFLSTQLSDMEDEMLQLKEAHLNELAQLKREHMMETEKKIQRLVTLHKTQEESFKQKNEMLFQQIQTLQDESLVLYGRNMIMAHELGKFT